MNAYTPAQMDFLKQLDDLPNGIDLTPEQTALVLSVDEDWLRKKRQQSEGAGPPFRLLGDGGKPSVRYPLGLLRHWQKERVFGNTHLAKQGIAGNFSSFLATATLLDTHTFILDAFGRPVPFAAGLEGIVKTLTLGEFCDQLKAAAAAEFFAKEKVELELPELPPNKTKSI
jgi:hypothetical protein